MKLTLLVAVSLAWAVSLVAAYPITGNGVHCRAGPGTNFDVKKTYPKGTDVKISCQAAGTSVNGNNIWDKTQDGCYVADYYVKTGVNGYVTTKCSGGGGGGGGGGGLPGPVKNDYPYSGKCGGVDPWNFYKCQCTSFVAWRINKRLGIAFTNQYKKVHWGNAYNWDNAAKQAGIRVDNNPVPGCIAQTDKGPGHVAWVTAVKGSNVVIEEYNYGTREAYGTRTVSKGTFKYIHIKV